MSDEGAEQVVVETNDDTPAPVEANEDTPAAATASEPVGENEQKKSVKFESNELSFDEAQAEIDAIKARAGQARENLKTASVASTCVTSSPYSSYTASSSYEEEVPKSKNMLSHLNSNSAMISYKVTTARNLVQKQEALLRNLKLMRENMERSSVEISRASDYLSPVRVAPRGYFEKRAESAPFISRRQVRELSPALSATCSADLVEKSSERAYSPAPVSFSSHISTMPAPVSSSDYVPDEDFEKEMAALRKRVSDLSSKANEVPMPKYSSYDYETSLTSSPLTGYSDTYALPEPKIEVKKVKTRKFVPQTHHTKLPARTVYTNSISKHEPIDNGITYPRNTYTDYLMDTLNDLDTTYANNSSLDMKELYADPLATSVTDYSVAY